MATYSVSYSKWIPIDCNGDGGLSPDYSTVDVMGSLPSVTRAEQTQGRGHHMARNLWVLCGIDTDAPPGHRVVFGPTSEYAALLCGYDMRWPSRVDVVVVLPVMDGGLLRVSKRDVDAAIAKNAKGE